MKLQWRLMEILSDRQIGDATVLQDRLREMGVDVRMSEIGKLLYEKPDNIRLDLLYGLTRVLDCSLSDLLGEHPSSSDKTAP